MQVWQCRRDDNFRGFGHQIYHDETKHPRFYGTKAMVIHQRSKKVGKEAKANVGRMHEDSRRNARAIEAARVLSEPKGSVRTGEFSGFMGCSLKNKTPILSYNEAEIHDKDFSFSGVESVAADIVYNCCFYPSSGPKQIDMRRYRDYIDLFKNYAGKQYWELSRPFKINPAKVGLFWSTAREFRTAHPLKDRTEWNEANDIVDAPVEPKFIPSTGIDNDAASTVSCSTIVQAAAPKVLPASAQDLCLPATAQINVDLTTVDTSDEAQSCISEHSLPPNVLIQTDSSSDDNLDITIPEFPEAIFADAIGVFDDTESEDLSSSAPLPWAVADQSLDVEVGDECSSEGPLVVIPPTAVPATQVLHKTFKHPFIDTEQQSDEWETEDEHETYLAYGTELPSSPYELPVDSFEGLSVLGIKSKCFKERLVSSDELLKIKLENLSLRNENRDLKKENETLKHSTSAKTVLNLSRRNDELVEDNETWRDRAVKKSARAAILSVSLSAVYDILDDMMWLRGATPLGFTVNSENTFHPRFGEGKQVLAKQMKKAESRSCPNLFDKCDPTSKHQCFNCISSFRVSACLAIVLDGLLKTEMSITKFQRLSSEPSTLSMIELKFANQKRPSESSTPLSKKPKQSRLSTGKKVLSNDLTKVSKPSFTDPTRFSQSSPMDKKNVNDQTIDDRSTQDFEIDVHASDSDAEYLSANE